MYVCLHVELDVALCLTGIQKMSEHSLHFLFVRVNFSLHKLLFECSPHRHCLKPLRLSFQSHAIHDVAAWKNSSHAIIHLLSFKCFFTAHLSASRLHSFPLCNLCVVVCLFALHLHLYTGLCNYYTAATTLQPLHCNHYTATTTLQPPFCIAPSSLYWTLQPLHCNHCVATTTLQPLHCNHYTATTTLQPLHHYTSTTTPQPLHCNHYTAATTLQPLHCNHYTATTTLQPLHCNHYTATTTLQPLHCNHYVATTTLCDHYTVRPLHCNHYTV